jgi:RNA polymerase sigma-70 factor (ECF subfamily)
MSFDFDKSLLENKELLHKYALNLTKDRDQASDLLQDTLVRALNSRDSFKPNPEVEHQGFKQWLSVIMRNEWISGFRRKKEHTMSDEEQDFRLNTIEHSTGANQEDSLELKQILEAIEKLPPAMQETFKIAVMEDGGDHDTIAENLGIASGTVKSRVSRARKTLADILNRGETDNQVKYGDKTNILPSDRHAEFSIFNESDNKEWGARPILGEVLISNLRINEKYQRTLSSKNSQKQIEKIVGNFNWSAFGAIQITPKMDEPGVYWVIDGQHRVEICKRLEITSVPAIISESLTEADQAKLFVRANKERVALTKLALFHAAVAANDPEALMISRICKNTGLIIPRHQNVTGREKPGETVALATIRMMAHKYGEETTTKICAIASDAYGDVPGAIRAGLLKGISIIWINKAHLRPKLAEDLTAILRSYDEKVLRSLVLKERAKMVSEAVAYQLIIARSLQSGKIIKKIEGMEEMTIPIKATISSNPVKSTLDTKSVVANVSQNPAKATTQNPIKTTQNMVKTEITKPVENRVPPSGPPQPKLSRKEILKKAGGFRL